MVQQNTCDPLINALRKGIETRFSNLTSFDVAKRLGKNYIIAAVAHPFFSSAIAAK